jgi:hypothetical protein
MMRLWSLGCIAALSVRAHRRKQLTPLGIATAVIVSSLYTVHPWGVFIVQLLAFYVTGTQLTKVPKKQGLGGLMTVQTQYQEEGYFDEFGWKGGGRCGGDEDSCPGPGEFARGDDSACTAFGLVLQVQREILFYVNTRAS